jgi:hypothetical protein
MLKHNTIGKGTSQRAVNGGDDKYYTKVFIADFCSNLVLNRYGPQTKYVEPTAGDGAFMRLFPNIVGYDLYPEKETILQGDVFQTKFDQENVIIGNPPFGMNSSTAIAVFNHIASNNVRAICFVLPKTFKKRSTHNKLNTTYHLVLEQDLPNNAFTVLGKDKHVPVVFQIWEHKTKQRELSENVSCPWLTFTTKDKADIAVRRAGGRAGQILENLDQSPSSTYFIKVKHPIVVYAIRLIDLAVVDYTAGVRSISQHELCEEVNRIMEILQDAI